MRHTFVVLPIFALGLAGCVGTVHDDEVQNDEVAVESKGLWFSDMPGYVAVGDSIDYGVGASPGNGYVSQFHAWLEDDYFGEPIDHLNLSVIGADSGEILEGQSKDAIYFNAKHLLQEKVITVGSGGNDLLNFIKSPEFQPCATGDQAGCQANLGAVLQTYADNLDRTLRRLRFLANEKHATLIARTQYTGFVQPNCTTDGAIDKDGNVFLPPEQVQGLIQLSFLALEGAVQDPTVADDPFPGLNDIMRAKAEKYDAVTVDLMGPFLAGIQSGQQLVIRDCVHPSDAGHDLIADLVIDAFQQHNQ